jgi:amidase
VPDDLCLRTAVEQVRLVRRGELSARELVAAHLTRIERLDPAVNAIPTLTPERALAAADALDRRRARGEPLPPLAGLAIAHKDLVDTAGVRTTYGSPRFADHVPEADELLVERMRAAGAVMVGKTNVPEWGAGSHTFNPVFGATRNPWDTGRSAGGSSGGAAASLACRMVAIADGSDLGGSLRNPAAWNGVLGLRPTPGLVARWPTAAPWSPLSVDGPMARTAADVALLLAAMAGPDSRDPLSQRTAAVELGGALDADLAGRRAAWSPTLGGLPVERGQLEVLETALPALERAGVGVDTEEPDLRGADEAFETWRALLSAGSLGEELDAHPDAIKPVLRREIERGRALTGAELARAVALHGELGERAHAFFERFDYLLCPVTQLGPFPVERDYPTDVAGVAMESYIEWMRACSRITPLGCPALSVPVGRTPDGLPVGLQVVAAPFAERALLELAHALEQALPPLGVPPLAT